MASSFSTLRQRGYGTFYAVKIESIPWIFTEGPVPYRVDYADSPGVPSGYIGQSASFLIVDKTTIDQELNRESAVARGKSLPLVLSWDVLEADGILDDLFRRPAYFTTLTADVAAADTTINVVSTSSFDSAGQFYIGRELVKYSGKTGTSFTGCSRGYLGYTYKFDKDAPGSHGMITPTPHSWRGRFVTIYEHLVSPEGRILDSVWTEGTYQRELWKGYVTTPPVPSQLGMQIEAANLVRITGQEIGSTVTATTVGSIGVAEGWLDLPVYVAAGASLEFIICMNEEDCYDKLRSVMAPLVEEGATDGDWPTLPPGVMSIRQYLEAACQQLFDDYPEDDGTGTSSPSPPLSIGISEAITNPYLTGDLSIKVNFGYNFPNTWWIRAQPPGNVYWQSDPTIPIIDENGMYFNYDDITVGDSESNITTEAPLFQPVPPYLVVKDIEGDTAIDFVLADSGMAVVEAGDNSEVIRWDDKITADYLGNDLSPVALLHVSERMVGAQFSSVEQLPANFFESGTLEVVSGAIGTLDGVAETLLESSGTGTRGSKDTLPLGFGLGIPEAWIDLDATGGSPLPTEDVPLLASGRSSWEEMFSGWYQLSGWCLALRRDTSNVLQLQRADVVPSEVISTTVAGYLGTALSKSDVIVGGTKVPRIIVAPNQVIIDTTAGPYESAQYTYNAVGRIQSEGVYSTELAVPGGRAEILSAAVLSIMSRGQGQSCIRFAVAPWVDIQVGDPISVTVAHPLLFQWSDGTRQPSNIAGRCVGWSFNMKTGEQTLTILMDGLMATGVHLCPVETVSLVSSNDVTVGNGSWWRSGETVRFYNRGLESTESDDLLVSTVTGNILTLDASPPAWLAVGTRATHPAYTSGSSDQTGPFMYDKTTRYWRV